MIFRKHPAPPNFKLPKPVAIPLPPAKHIIIEVK